MSGWLVGLPLTSGPVALFLALDLGTTFATRAAQNTMLGIVSVAGFCLAYSWLSMRVGWPGSVLAGWSVFFALTAILERFSAPLDLSFVGAISCLGGTVAGAVALYEKWALGIYVHRNPFILLAVFLFLLGVQCVLMGLLAELLVRTYHESQNKLTYTVAELVNFEDGVAR